MTTHSVAEAKNHLSKLIDRALEGEEVVITRHGTPVIEFRAIGAQPRALAAADFDWLAAHRVGRVMPAEDAGSLVSGMRDESER